MIRCTTWGPGQAKRALFPSPADGGVRYICMLCMLCNIQRCASPQGDGSQLSFVGFVCCAAARAHEPSSPLNSRQPPCFVFLRLEAHRVFRALWTPITWCAEPCFSKSLFSVLIGPIAYENHTELMSISTGNTYSIRNVGSGTARVFFAQAKEDQVQDAE